jgi:hypothetical protein
MGSKHERAKTKKIKAGPLRFKGLVKTMWAGPKVLTGLERSAR